MKMKKKTLDQIRRQITRVRAAGGFYAKRLKNIDPEDIQSQADFEKLPFSEKADLRDAYPLGLSAVPASEIVRIHSSSGTTGISRASAVRRMVPRLPGSWMPSRISMPLCARKGFFSGKRHRNNAPWGLAMGEMDSITSPGTRISRT